MVDAKGFQSMYKMRRITFNHVCSLVRISFLEDMMARDHTFVDGRLLSLQDGVAVALRVLNSGGSPVTVGSSLGVNESTVLLVTQVFVQAMWDRAFLHVSWPGSAQMEKMKRKLDKIHGLPNCCGIVQTAHITFGSHSGDCEENGSMLMQAVVDPDMRFTGIWLGPSGTMNQVSVLHDSWLFKYCQEGTQLNGSNLKLSEGSYVGEYIIGDAGYPLLPRLLTPYQIENDKDQSAYVLPYQAEFNRRHAAASTIMTAALARLKDTWRILDRGVGSCPPFKTIYACCMLHNIVIDMEEGEEEEEVAGMEEEVRQIADEDAVRVRDVLAKHLIESSREEEKEAAAAVVAPSAGDQNKEQQCARRPQTAADRGKEKAHDS